MKSGNLNFLEPSGPLHACNGTALPLCSIGVLKSIISLNFVIWREFERRALHISIYISFRRNFAVPNMLWAKVAVKDTCFMFGRGISLV